MSGLRGNVVGLMFMAIIIVLTLSAVLFLANMGYLHRLFNVDSELSVYIESQAAGNLAHVLMDRAGPEDWPALAEKAGWEVAVYEGMELLYGQKLDRGLETRVALPGGRIGRLVMVKEEGE